MATIQRLRGLLLGLVPAVVVLAVSAAPALAQAIFTGRVLGPSSAPLEGASVTIRELAVEVLTNNQGRFAISMPRGPAHRPPHNTVRNEPCLKNQG